MANTVEFRSACNVAAHNLTEGPCATWSKDIHGVPGDTGGYFSTRNCEMQLARYYDGCPFNSLETIALLLQLYPQTSPSSILERVPCPLSGKPMAIWGVLLEVACAARH